MNLSIKEMFKNFNIFESFKDKNNVLGVDIGSSSVKVVQLRREKEKAVLETYGEVATGPYGNLKVSQPVKLPPDALAGAIKDVMKESNAKAKIARVAIPLKSSFVKIMTLPIKEEKNLADIISMEARRHIPVPISEVALDWWVLPNGPGKDLKTGEEKKTTEVLLVAIHNDVISEYKNVIAKAGLVARAYEIESFSMIRSAIGRGSQTIAVIDLGASATKMAVVDYGVMKESHFVNKGLYDLTLALSQSLGVDHNRAEEIKREIGLSDLPEHREMVAVMEPILDYIFHEANIFLKDFQNKSGRSVSKVVLTGGGAMLKGIISLAVKKLTVEVELADPFSKVEHPVFLSDVLKSVGINFSVAIGLALGEL